MALKLFNYLTKKKEIFRPLKAGKVGLYTCGPTVYDTAHLGNLRTYIFEDVLRRTLKANGLKVKQVMNITDVEDKIIKKMREEKKRLKEITEPNIKIFFQDLKKLNIEKAEVYPKATEHIQEIIKLIAVLLKKGLAYKAEDDSIYFKISKFKNYGQLSGLKSKDVGRPYNDGRRISEDEYKKEAADFALWKARPAKAGREPSWPSPFGPGRPGWHIECSAMSMKYLGKTFDIHAGAIDLLFPHHENEIAQSQAATGKKFVNFWLEGEHLLVSGQKMAKSLKNFLTLKDIEKKGFDPLVFRYLVLTSHYRKKLNFTWNSLKAGQNALDKLKEILSATTGLNPLSRDLIQSSQKFLEAI
ncbi:MAG: cysteine--tRNA ligase, partial [Patescibacteria group bacterium]